MEFVFVLPREKLFPEAYPQGFTPFRTAADRRAFDDKVREHGFFVERAYAEHTPLLKQVIPYTLIVSDGRLLLMRRLPRGGERRLHGKLSIGVGGHINPEDVREGVGPIEGCTRREIEEEIDVRGSYELRIAGFLNDDSNPVGAVHVGIVQTADVRGSIAIRELDVLEGRLVLAEELKILHARGEDFETWSSILVGHLDELVRHLEPAGL